MTMIKLCRLAKDAETRATKNGKSFIAISAVYNVGYGEKQEGVFITAQYWGSEGILPYLKKGKQVVLAMDSIRPYHNHKDGKDYVGLYADVRTIELVAADKSEKPEPKQESMGGQAYDDFNDSIPFAAIDARF
jgi:single-stranded DNA-binding protein